MVGVQEVRGDLLSSARDQGSQEWTKANFKEASVEEKLQSSISICAW